MGKDAQETIVFTGEAKKKFQECVAALVADRFGPEGPPKETTFTEMEDYGHEVGRMLARAVEAQLTVEHQTHFQQETPCPTCETPCPPKEETAQRRFQTIDGKLPLDEIVCHCPVCNRDFFPSADSLAD